MNKGAEPAWFGAAMARELAPIRQDLIDIRADLTTLSDRAVTMDDRLRSLEVSTAHIRRMSAIVEPLFSFISLVFH